LLIKGGWAAAICVLFASGVHAQPDFHMRALTPIPLFVGDDAGPQSFTLADVNKDGKLDLIAVERPNDSIAILLGAGDGTFSAPVEYEVDDTPTAVAVVDVASPFASETSGDVDGNPDIVVTDEDGFAYIFLGRGDGTFDPPEQELDEVLDASELIGVVVGDFDRNGRADLALLDAFDEVYFLCNDAGNFAPCPTIVVETNGSGAVAIGGGNFDNDGFEDLVVLSRDSADFSVLYGGGNGTFTTDPSTFPAKVADGNMPSGLAIADLDRDTVDDILIVSNENFDNLSALLARTLRRNVFQRTALTAPFSDTMAVALGDLDDDGETDAVFAYRWSSGAIGPAILLGDGSGQFQDLPFTIPGAHRIGPGRAIQLGKIDGDARLDLVQLAADGASLTVALGESGAMCDGDCNQDGRVSIDELILGVGIALGSQPASQCVALDGDGSNTVEINELIAAVGAALQGCS
jgi:hypothetical protein